MSNTIKDLAQLIKDPATKSAPKPYDTTATVKRIEGDTVWVSIPGGVDETPISKTINCSEGDTVQVRVSGGRAWIVGNASAPPTDDKAANQAQETADTAQTTADEAVVIAEEAQSAAQSVNQYFWHTETDNGAGAGAHITEMPQADFLADPTNGGGNLLGQSTGISVRDGLTDLATFGSSGVQIGQDASGESRTEISTSGMQIIQNVSGTDTEIANLGYGSGIDSGGGTSDAPYYTLGTRKSGSTVGNYSFAEGKDTIASGYNSHAEGYLSTASDSWSHAEGLSTTASGSPSHAEGGSTTASGSYAHSEGLNTKATGEVSHAEGQSTTASGNYSHAEGISATASGRFSHAEGVAATASGEASRAGGYESTASGDYSHAQNYFTIADQQSQTAIGEYNTANNTNNLFVIGNGTADNARSDAFEVDNSGNVVAAGDITAGGKLYAGGLPSGLTAEDVLMIDNYTISGLTYGNGNKSVAKTGYTPIGIVGMHIQNATTGGQNNTTCAMHSWYLSGTTAYWIVRGTTSNTAKIKVTATILYVKS